MLAFLRRWSGLPVRTLVFDVCVAGCVLLMSLLPLMPNAVPGSLPVRIVLVALGTVMAAALLIRRRWPVPVFLACGAAATIQALLGAHFLGQDIAVPVALYSVVKFVGRVRWAWLGLAATLVGSMLTADHYDDWSSFGHRPVMVIVFTLVIFLIGLTMRTRRLYVHSLEDRATTLERERDQRARLAVAEERTRIARELHDVVAHSLAVMIVQADGAGYAFDREPETAREAVRTIAGTGREALAEMHRLVEVLRAEDAERPRAVEPAAAGLERIDDLADRFRVSGLDVTLDRRGTPAALPTGIDLAAYRIVQESLTNTLKHGGAGTSVAVTVDHRPAEILITVEDDGAGRGLRGGADLSGGHGLPGMRERVAVYGGEFDAGRRLDGGWRVRARLPVPPPGGTRARPGPETPDPPAATGSVGAASMEEGGPA